MFSLPISAAELAFLIPLASVAFLVLKPLLHYLLDPLDLRKYPVPSFLAATTHFWILKETWLQRRSRSIHRQHERLGDIIRIAPSLLIFNIPEAVPDIYGHAAARKLVKDTFYDKIAGDERDIVNVIDHGDHSRRRKYLANSFALKTVTDMEPAIRQNLQRLIDYLDEITTQSITSQTLDIRRWFNYFTLDVIGDMAFGLPMGFLAGRCDTTRVKSPAGHEYCILSTIDALHRGTRLSTTLAQLSSIRCVKVIKRLCNSTNWLKQSTGAQGIKDFDNVCISQLNGRLDNGSPDRPQRDFMNKILKDREGGTRELSFQRLLAESIVFMNAGSETTAAALSSTLYFLLSNPKCFEKLRTEIDARLEPNHDGIVSYDSARDVPYLRACIDESLRLRPPIAYALQRLVVSPQGAIIAGHHIKQGTTVAVSPWTVHRNRKLYKNPDEFDPGRWFDPEQLSNLRRYNIVFSQGPRQCLGRHIAIVELQILISTLVRRYNIYLADQAMDFVIFDRFNSNPGPLPVKVEQRVFVD
ncbi:related to benzoate 4-monooxygenase cytochrome P450 [Fusarium fujikuroi IMI 58289]|uniref:Related to benzoate 4-monooxygenase cytochrome P450 n=1 Tax=Gibberella fujikuroi (strain CBS 195.34 / IMI 58289 / NRRL A-6831) TaxID=1279085 RepID=S0ELB0_GIBF5|nr:related to benzoate 4-monooxygenase cytochrome P450 [Fusarium fujikuroi IMI 58289]CCT74692.1 related to benzoate 4-monooxygenase cytochrome P450 [Fusarium fujikuroi IMI 58289]SCO05064.1 related to benzoate 4-monooxygenase cytochrome P450 [Fusarium fujikuroi]SCO57972.1 related to benzoate 4-monooxygenase cytochrome P450 [Fusarium fujikuroi]